MLSQRKSCYCAFCKVERKVYANKHLSLIDILGLVLLGITITYAVFKSLDPTGLLFVGLLLVAGEVFAQAKWRTSMVCSNCAFDPIIYIRDPEQAGLKIKAFLEKRPDSPAHLLRPPIARPVIVKREATGKNLSLKI
jgi:hypothetical protein